MPWLGRVFRVDYERQKGLGEEQHERLAAEVAVVRIRLGRTDP